MHQNLSHLMKTRRFLPLFITQFLGALNDNLFKQALVLLAVFGMADNAGLLSDFTGQIAVIAGGLFIVPFFLFSATAGQLADKFEKAALIRRVKLAEIAIMALAAIGFSLDPAFITLKVLALMAVLFFMGIQSAFFGPLKYAILPTHLRPEELVGGNGLIEAATFLAILIGTIAGGLLILQPSEAEPLIFGPFRLILDGKGIIALSILLIALAGWISSFFIPQATPADPNLRVSRNILVETARVVAHARADRRVFLSILGISWFWLIGITFISLLAPFVGDVLGAKGKAGSHVTTLTLTLFSIGIAAGSLMTNRLLKGEISAKYVPVGALGISLSILALFFSVKLRGGGGEIEGVLPFLQDPTSWPILISLSLIAVFGGFYIVPLYAIMQHFSDPKRRARVIAGNNILNALFMTASSVVVAILLSSGVSIPAIFLLLAVLNFGVALYICKLLPEAVVKPLVAGFLKLLFKVELRGVENYAKAGPRAVIVANHVSWLDGMLLAAFLPRKPVIAVDTHTALRWWATPFLSLVEFYPIDPTNPLSTKSLIREVQAERHCVIFPEGRLTTTGALMKIYEGPGMIADKADADIIPVRIDGAQFCKVSRLKGKTHLRWFPKITLTILPPGRFEVPEGLVGRRRREVIGEKLYDLMSDMVFRTCNHRRTLFEALIDAGEIYGPAAEILGDAERHTLDYKKLIQSSFVLGHRFTDFTHAGENVGLMLPNGAGGAVAFFALQAFCRVPAMLNFTAGARAMDNACRAAGVKKIITSRRFIQMAKLETDLEILSKRRSVHYLEDIREEIGLADKAYGFLSARMANRLHRYNAETAEADPDSPAVVLFTSGSEGLPKAVVLSHANLLANAHQLGSRIDFNPSDTVFNALPLFHSFGLSSGLLLPLLSGVKVFLYPSPLHYRIIPELVYGTNATILFGTDTFLAGYARVAHPYDFYSLRYVFAGAERVKDATRRAWSGKFGHRILEGYGATETSPVISSNTPMHYRAGTVGRLLPGIEAKLEAVPGIEEGGRLHVRGPNVMLGYYRVDAPLQLEPPKGGWYDTGDIVEIDAAGFITIKGRVKRFAKIAGEMVSLSAVEEAASALWPDSKLAAINLPDERKGEQVYLLIDRPEATREAFVTHARKKALPELMVPRQVFPGAEIPLLGSGKIDYSAAKIQAEDLMTGKLPGLTPG